MPLLFAVLAGCDAPAGAPGLALGTAFVAPARAADTGPPPRFDAGPAPVEDGPFFEVATAEAGLDGFDHYIAVDEACEIGLGLACLLPFHMGGLAVGDVNADGWPDLWLSSFDGGGTLFVGWPDGTFLDFTDRLGLDGIAVPTNGAAFADVDRDGDEDLYLTTVAPAGGFDRHLLFFQLPDGTFEDRAVQRGAALQMPETIRGGSSVAVGDFDRDGYVDLHINEFRERGVLRPTLTRLLQNRGTTLPGYFADVTRERGASDVPQVCWSGAERCDITSFSNSFSDLDDDGWPDLLVVRDYGTSRLLWNEGGEGFVDGTEAAHVGTDENGMGSTVGDIDNDGDLDWFISSVGEPGTMCGPRPCLAGVTGNRLYRNLGGREFEDATDEAGVRQGGWGWGTAFFDYDNDGDLDLVLTNGYDTPHDDFDDLWNEDPMRLWQNDGTGHFTDVAPEEGMTAVDVGMGLVVFDWERDGDLDVLIMRNHLSPLLYRNRRGNENAWLRVRLEGTRSTLEGLGARVRVRVGDRWQMREMGSTTHFYGQSERVAHFGLGPEARTVDEVEVRWPSGMVTRLSGVPARQEIVVAEE
jgi:hypothetical protein